MFVKTDIGCVWSCSTAFSALDGVPPNRGDEAILAEEALTTNDTKNAKRPGMFLNVNRLTFTATAATRTVSGCIADR